MAAARILTTFAIIAVSMAVGFIAFYMLSNLSKSHKKKWMTEIISQLFNFVIFIWIGKIVLNLGLFIKDPLAVLAYPSNSHAFYLATLFGILTLAYKQIRQQLDVTSFIHACIPVFLIASFVYEFIQFVWFSQPYVIGYMTILALLIIVFLLLQDRIQATTLTVIILIGWTAGILALTFIVPYITIFGYMIAPWFVSLIFVTIISFIIIKQRRKVS